MDRFLNDFHIHTEHLKCANATMTVKALVAECARLGLERIAITDHLNHLDFLPKHQLILNDLKTIAAPLDIYWSVELNYMSCDGDYAFNAEVKEKMGFQFAIGGIHATYLEKGQYDLRKIVDIQHRHHLKTCADPLVDILVHPYWFSKGEYDPKGFPWFDSMKAVPDAYARELGQAAQASGTAIEINGSAIFANPSFCSAFKEEYKHFLQVIAAEGALFSVGSDAHDVGELKNVLTAVNVAKEIGLKPSQMWQPIGTPFLQKTV